MTADRTTRVLITGAPGFIGAHVTHRALAAGKHVAILALPDDPLTRLREVVSSVEIIRGDLGSRGSFVGALREFQPEMCIHLAWYTEPGQYLNGLQNLGSLQGSLNLIEALELAHCRHLLAVGTCAEYETSEASLNEGSPTRPTTLYGATKLSLHLMATVLAARAGITYSWARLFYLYGPGEDSRRLVPSVIRSLMRGEEFPATEGTQVRDYLHVEDVASGLWHLAERQQQGIYNICSGIPVTVRQLLDTVGNVLGRADLVRFGAIAQRDWEPDFICGANAKLCGIGWSPRYGLLQGLEQTIDWWASLAAAQPGGESQ